MESYDKQRELVTEVMERIREIIGTSHEAIQQLSKMNIHVATATKNNPLYLQRLQSV